MAKIEQYRPAFVTGFENEEVEFETLEELLSIDWVNNFKLNPNGSENPNFFRYSRGELHPESNTYNLMAEYDNGYTWWVVGMMEKNSIADQLPEIEYKKR